MDVDAPHHSPPQHTDPPSTLEDAPDAEERASTHPAGNYLRGVVMGTADLVPGVSGGTMALITGIYERLVATVRAFTGIPFNALRGDRTALRRSIARTEWLLLLPVLAGMGTAIVLGSGFLPQLLEDHPEQMLALFLGMIIASVPLPWSMIENRGMRAIGLAILGAILAFVLAGLPPNEVDDPALLVVLLSAMVAICAMVLPGVSGSYLLLVLGMYEVTLDAVHDRDLAYVAVFAAGALLGLGLFSRVLGWLLEHHHGRTMALLVGLMIGSVRALWPWQDDDRGLQAPPSDGGELLQVALFALAGFVAVTALTFFAKRLDRD